MRTNKNTSKKAFRELGVTYSIIAAIRHYSDAQILCMNHRLSSSYLVAIRGMEEVGKAFLLNDGADLRMPGGHEKKLTTFFESLPWFNNIEPDLWAKRYTDEANNARYVDVIDMNDNEFIWNYPMVRFETEVSIGYLFYGINYFLDSVFNNDAMIDEYKAMNLICGDCYNQGGRPPQMPCKKGNTPSGFAITEIHPSKLRNSI